MNQRAKTVYAWIAETAYQLKSKTIGPVSFHPTKATRDATTRINVQVGDKNRVFVVSAPNHHSITTPREVYEYFNPRDPITNKRTYPQTFEPTTCGHCGLRYTQHEVPGYRCPTAEEHAANEAFIAMGKQPKL